MHILVVNDDAGHTVSVVLPHSQRSWIGKAHLVGKTVTPTYFRPGTLHTDDGTTHDRPRQDGGEEWILVDGTPASCAQIGIHHYFNEKGPIDLVVSGPNYGRNSTALFALSSGTIGGAMEAAIIIKGASTVSVRIVKYLHENWKEGVDLYSVNVPLIEDVDKPKTKILYTSMLQNYWTSGSSFEPVDAEDELSPEESEAQIRELGEGEVRHEEPQNGLRHRKFKWAPKLQDVLDSVETVSRRSRQISCNPEKDLIGQEVHLPIGETILEDSTKKPNLEDRKNRVYALVDYEDAYVEPKILAALRKYVPSITAVRDPSELPQTGDVKVLTWSAYEKIPFEEVVENPDTILSCSYIIRKALIRKHHLALTVRHHIAKNPASILTTSFPITCDFELDFAEFLDEALMEAYEVAESLADNEKKEPNERTWWILKPGMSDRGQGIRLFSTTDELTEIFESFEEDSDDGDEDRDDTKNDTSVVTNQLRHFVAQQYVHPPLLVDSRKFHIRTYVLAVGGLKVFVYKHMLALFAARKYSPPWEDDDLTAHLTNTCLQTGEREGSVRLFWNLGKEVGKKNLQSIWEMICGTVAETFEGAARGQRVHFQTLPNAFEIYGVDFVVGKDMEISLLEVNAYPDFKQTGEELGGIIQVC
ncbi:tubulin-tyrosine ligase family-domain-containing protein [Trichophaea hybrida]|nr:tubulin-tyrosine ligase family-domain-containing protein [Trichophaea hybrida]